MAESVLQETYLSVYAPIRHNERVLLAYNQNGPYRGMWGLPGGGIEFGETPEAAMRREIWEEVGVEVETLQQIGVQSVRTRFTREPDVPVDFHHIALLYDVRLAAVPSERIVSPDAKEKVAWFRLTELASLPLSPFAREWLLPADASP